MGRFSIATGELYSHRQRFGLPTYGPAFFVFEIAILVLASGLLIARSRVRFAGGLMVFGTAMSLTQVFQHQKLLFLIVGVAVMIVPLGMSAVSVYFLRTQLIIVYVFSVISKLATGFLESQDTLTAMEYSVRGDPFRSALLSPALQYLTDVPFSYFVVGAEIIVPLLLIKVPRAGFALAVLLHFTMAAFLANVMPFSILMIALAMLYFPTDELNDATPS